MAETDRFALEKFGGSLGGTLADHGDKFTLRDRDTIDAVLAALEQHRHTGGSAAAWTAGTAYGLGTQVVPTVRNGHVYVVAVAGTSGGSQPTWPTTTAATVVDGTVTWMEAGSDQTTKLADPSEPPTAELIEDPPEGNLPAGTTYYYRVGFVDAYGLETAASEEGEVTTPEEIPTPDPPAVDAAAGGDLAEGDYDYAITFYQDAGGGETDPSPSSVVSLRGGDGTAELTLPPLETGADGWKIYRLAPGEGDLYLLRTQPSGSGDSWSDDGSVAASTTVTVPLENTTNDANAVTITCPDVAGGLVPAGVRAWRIYRTESSGDYEEASLVHEVVETTTEGGTILVDTWDDIGDPLLDGIPLEHSTTFQAPGPVVSPRPTAAQVSSTATGTVAATNVQAAIAELEAEKLGLGTATPVVEGTGAVGTSPLGARQDHVHPAGVGSATPLVESGAGAAGSSALSSRQDHVHPADGGGGGGATDLEGLSDVDLTSPSDGQVLTYDSGTSQWVNEAPSGGGGGATDLEGLSDVDLTSPAEDQLLIYDGSQWVNADLPGGGGGGGALDDLSDVTVSGPADYEVLFHFGGEWYNGQLALSFMADVDAPIGSAADGQVLVYDGVSAFKWVPGSPALASLLDVLLTDPADGDALVFRDDGGQAVAITSTGSSPGSSGQQGWAQSFTPDAETVVAAIDAKFNFPDTGTIRLGLADAEPDDTASVDWIDGSYGELDAADIVNDQWIRATLSAPVTLAAATEYWLVIQHQGATSATGLRVSNTDTAMTGATYGSTISAATSDGVYNDAETGWHAVARLYEVVPGWINDTLGGGGGATDLEGLSDVDLTSPAEDEVLTFDGTEWVNQALPAGVTDLEGLSDVDLTSPADGHVLTFDSGTSQWVNEAPAGGGGGLPSRATENYTTASLATDASETGTIDLALSYRLLKLETSRPARVRIYATAAHRTADAARPIGTDPTDDHGLMLEYITTAGLLEVVMSPQVDGSNFEASPSAAIPLAITNLDASTGTVSLDLTYLPQEA